MGTQWDADPAGQKRHEDVVARTNTQIKNTFIGLGVGMLVLLGVDYMTRTVPARREE